MLDVLTWMWHDPHLQGSRAGRVKGTSASVPQLRPDLIALEAQRRKRLIARGRYIPPMATPQALPPGTPRSFKPEYVIQLAKRVAAVLSVPHRFVCIVDEIPPGCDELACGVHWIKTPAAALTAGAVRSPEGNRFPSCYRRLWAQSEEAAGVLSERCLLIDMDLVPIKAWDKLVNRDEPFVGWRPYRDWGRQMRIGGGVYLFTPGANAKVWTDFYTRPQAAVAEAAKAGFRGSDQAWLSYKLAGQVPVYGRHEGIYSIRDLGSTHELPKDARMVQMNGPAQFKPWSYRGPAAWVAEHWQGR